MITLIEKVNGVTYLLYPNKSEAVVLSIDDIEELNIPQKIQNCYVVSIEKSACENKKSLKHVSLPITIETIKERAFCRCCNLESVTIAALTVNLDEKAFFECSSLASFSAYNIVLNGKFVFANCKQLPEFIAEETEHSVFIGRIPMFSFLDCEKLTRLEFSDANIENSAFMGCSSLEIMKFHGKTTLGPGIHNFIKKRKLLCSENSGLTELVYYGTSVTVI